MRFIALGDIRAEGDDGRGPVALGGPRQRTLLAYLLTRPNQQVTAASVVEVLWDGEAEPANPERAVQTYVSRLRGVLDNDRIRSGPGGYSLTVHDGEFDVDRYLVTVEQARAAARSGDPARAAALYTTVDDLWNGQPWAELADRFWALESVKRLTSLRATAGEEHAECLLEMGDASGALERVQLLLAGDPLENGLRRVEMTALYRLGRAVEATRAFQHHRTTMLERTGLEPPAELSDLEARIVRQDPSLDGSGPTIRGFELIERLDESELGVVWRARQPSLEREVRLTVVDPAVADDPEFIRYFDAQVRQFSRVDHPSVGSLLDAWRDYRGAFIVSPLPLTVADSPPTGGWSVAAVRNLLADLGSAAAELHRHGLSVGRIGLGDIGLDDSGRAMLLGFTPDGGAASVDEDLRTLAAIGLDLLDRSPDVDSQLVTLLDRLVSGQPESDGEHPDLDWFVARMRPIESSAVDVGRNTGIRDTGIRNPYKGLMPFDLGDAEDFFGRKDVVADLVGRLSTGRFVTVVGSSGSGKSSVVRAGVLPALMANAELGGQPWFGVTMTPGSDPFGALEAALLRIAVNPPPTLLDQLTADVRGIVRAVDRTLPDDRSDLLLLVDQFEELWTVSPPEERERFLSALTEAIRDSQSRVRIVATLRADFYDRPLADPDFGSLLAEHAVALPALTAADLEEVIVGPARRVGLEIEPSVVAEFVRAGTSDAASLPLIQFTLTELVDNRRADIIGSEDLARLGGIEGSIGRRAEATYQEVEDGAKDQVRFVFGRLVSLNPTGTTRRRAAQSELATPEAQRAVDAFVAARLLTYDRDHETREPTVEVAHEALLTAWPRLTEWIEADADDLRVVGRLVSSAERWQDSEGEEGELLRGAPLAAAVELAERDPQRLSDTEHRFVAASAGRLEADQNRERRRSRRLRQALASVAVLLAAALIAGSVAVGQRNSARQAAFDAESFRLLQPADNLADSDPSVALLLAAEAYRRSPSPETLGVIQRVALKTGPFLGHRLPGVDVRAVRWLDGNRIVALSDEAVVMFSASSGEILDQIPYDFPLDDPLVEVRFYEPKVAVDEAGTQVAVTAAGGTVALFEATADRLAAVGSVAIGTPVRSLAFAPDGAMLYVGDANGSAHEIDPTEQRVTASWEVFKGPDWMLPDGYSTGDINSDFAKWLNQNGVAGVSVTDDLVAAVGGSRIAIWDRATRSLRWSDYAVDPATSGPEGEPVLVLPRWIGGDEEQPEVVHLMGPVDLVGSVNVVSGSQDWKRAEGLTRTSMSVLGLETEFANGFAVSIADDGALRTVDPISGDLSGEVVPILTGRPAGLGLAPDGRKAAVATTTGVGVIALDGSGLLNSAFPVTVEPDELTVAPGGLVAGTTSFSSEGVTVFDRTDAGYEHRELDPGRNPALIELSGQQAGDPQLGMEWRLGEDSVVSIRVIDAQTLEPISNWLDDAATVTVDHDNGLQYVRHEIENLRRPYGEHLFRIYEWPNGPEVAEPIEVPTGEVGAYPRIVLDGGRLLVGTHLLVADAVWAYDMEKRELVDPPFAVEGGVEAIRYGPNRSSIFITRRDGVIEERNATSYELIRQMAGQERPTGGADSLPVPVDPERDLWMTIFAGHPRLLDPNTGVQIGATFPHDDRAILIGTSDGHDGAPMQLVTAVDGTARVWNLATETWFDLACAAAGRNLTEEEWELLGPRDSDYQVTCAQWPSGAGS